MNGKWKKQTWSPVWFHIITLMELRRFNWRHWKRGNGVEFACHAYQRIYFFVLEMKWLNHFFPPNVHGLPNEDQTFPRFLTQIWSYYIAHNKMEDEIELLSTNTGSHQSITLLWKCWVFYCYNWYFTVKLLNLTTEFHML